MTFWLLCKFVGRRWQFSYMIIEIVYLSRNMKEKSLRLMIYAFVKKDMMPLILNFPMSIYRLHKPWIISHSRIYHTENHATTSTPS